MLVLRYFDENYVFMFLVINYSLIQNSTAHYWGVADEMPLIFTMI